VTWQEPATQQEVSQTPQHGGNGEEKKEDILLGPGAMEQHDGQRTQEGNGC
jgi:hypothetical protein